MTGKISGFKAEVKKVCPDAKHIHCIIHREHLVFRHMCSELTKVLNEVMSIVNFVKRNALNTRLFSILCKEMDSMHGVLLFYHSFIILKYDGYLAERF